MWIMICFSLRLQPFEGWIFLTDRNDLPHCHKQFFPFGKLFTPTEIVYKVLKVPLLLSIQSYVFFMRLQGTQTPTYRLICCIFLLFLKVLPFSILLSLILADTARERQKHSCRFGKKILLWWQLSKFLNRRDRNSIHKKEDLFWILGGFPEWP